MAIRNPILCVGLIAALSGCPNVVRDNDAGDASTSDTVSAEDSSADAMLADLAATPDSASPLSDGASSDVRGSTAEDAGSSDVVELGDASLDAWPTIDVNDRDAASDGSSLPPDAMDDRASPVDAPDAGASWPSDPCEQIALARTRTGAFSPPLRISEAIVSWVTPASPASTHGVFVQCRGAVGPALYLALSARDSAYFPTLPTPGTRVSFEIRSSVRVDGQHRVLDIANWTVSAGSALTPRDVSTVALPAVIDEYESELVALTAQIAGPRLTMGAGFAAYQITTAGVAIPSSSLVLRMPTAVADAVALREGCSVTIPSTPLWRFGAVVQPHVWSSGEIRADCPVTVPSVLSASAPTNTRVDVRFSLPMNSASLPPSAFVMNPAVPVTSVMISGTTATLTTSPLSGARSYTVTVAPTATSIGGVAIDPMRRAASFALACPAPTHLVINEVDYDMLGSADSEEFIELYNPTTSAIDLSTYTLVLVNGTPRGTPPAPREYDRVVLSGSLGPGQFAVVTAGPVAGVYAVRLPAGVARFVFAGGAVTDRIQNGGSAAGSPPAADAIVLMNGSSIVDAVAYEGDVASFLPPEPATMPTTVVTEGSMASASDEAMAGAIARVPNGCDRDVPSTDWHYRYPSTPGAAN